VQLRKLIDMNLSILLSILKNKIEMNIISFNIMFKDGNRKIVLTETPYLFVNDDLRSIINEIQKLLTFLK